MFEEGGRGGKEGGDDNLLFFPISSPALAGGWRLVLAPRQQSGRGYNYYLPPPATDDRVLGAKPTLLDT